MVVTEEISREELENVVRMYSKLPKEERTLLSNSAYTLYIRNQMMENRQQENQGA